MKKFTKVTRVNLPLKEVDANPFLSRKQADPYDYTIGCQTPASSVFFCIYSADISTVRGVDVVGDPHNGPTNRIEYAANGSCADPRRWLQLPSHFLQTALAVHQIGPGVDSVHHSTLSSRRPYLFGGGRYCRRAQRQESVWQGLSSRCGSFQPFLHCIPMGSQMGGAGYSDQVSMGQPSMGSSSTGGIVSFQGIEQRMWATPQNSSCDRATAFGCVATLVPRANFHSGWGWRLQHARLGLFGTAASKRRSSIGWTILSPCQSLCAAASKARTHRKTTNKRPQTSSAADCRCKNQETHALDRSVVRWANTQGRGSHGRRSMVQNGARTGCSALDLCARSERNASRRILFQHRCPNDSAADYRNLHGAMVHRSYFRRNARLFGIGDNARLDSANGAAHGALSIRTVLGCGAVV